MTEENAMHSDDIHEALQRPITAEEFVAEVESAELVGVMLFRSQQRRVRAHMERLNRDPFFKDDPLDSDDEEDVSTTLGALIEAALRAIERHDGLVSDAFGNLRSFR
jgi:hypothetical protein